MEVNHISVKLSSRCTKSTAPPYKGSLLIPKLNRETIHSLAFVYDGALKQKF
jgi:hypothetical protein